MRGTKKKKTKTKSTHPIMLLHLQPVVLAIIEYVVPQRDL